MNISIFGLGYVGCVTAAVLTKQNHNVIGVDVNKQKVETINKGKSPILEPGVQELFTEAVKKGILKATTNREKAIIESEISVICVGTPSNEDGSCNLTYVTNVINQIIEILKNKQKKHTIILRSTVPPGTVEKLLPKLKKVKINLCFNPEFLREGTGIKDYFNPPYIITAVDSKKTEKIVREFYKEIKAPFIVTDFKVAETLKIVNNVFHALKITFTNEIKRFCEAYDINSKEIMNLVCKDKKLNISEKYLKPGFAYGGSCLPKDLRSFKYLAKNKNISIPVIEKISLSNRDHIKNAINKISSHKKRSVSFIGLSFKQGTDDLRESPYIKLVEHFIGKGYSIKIHDPNVYLSKLIGTNKTFIEKEIPHIAKLLHHKIEDVMDSEIIVINHNMDIKKYLKKDHSIIDLR